VRPPEGEVTIVFSDITRAASLWEFSADAMRDATLLHNQALRALLKRHRGYEVLFARYLTSRSLAIHTLVAPPVLTCMTCRDRSSGEGSFCIAFQHTSDAVQWCMEAQKALVDLSWPEALLDHPGAAEEWNDNDNAVLYRGLRVRMGVHVGETRTRRDPMSRRVEYSGPVVNTAARITAMAHGGQILLSHSAHAKLKDTEVTKQAKRIVCLGKFDMPDVPHGTIIASMLPSSMW
jgi:class 3 adenylate cyclase